ncbi:unnamed protein product [Mytilus coruscus]|uniref:TIR domain-containing protein n=1 Tax=Mytilus coruscus TaxID=42192 RepID=A0A6J8ER65_MYTCO|nr:unnamed protein product [Mytilus coruscus]
MHIWCVESVKRSEKYIFAEVKDIKREEKEMEVTDESIDQQNLNVFLWHSKELKDLQIVTDIVVPRMEQLNVKIYPQDRIEARQLSTTSVTKLLNMTEKILIFISKNSLCSTWCSLELMTSVEQFQRINSCATVLLLYDLLESEVPHLPVFDDAAIVHVSNDKDEWADKVMEALTGERCRIMKARNVAPGLAWSHFYGFQQYVLPILESKVKESDWYRTQSAEIQSKVSFKLYEVIPKSCRQQDDFSKVDRNIQFVTTIPITFYIRAGNHRNMQLMVYSITDGQETFYCMCETPSVISVFRKMEDHNLVRFEHIYEGTGEHSEASLKVDDCTLQLNRLCYAMKSIVNHFEPCTGTARVMLFDDEKESISNVLFDAVKEELQHVELKMQYAKLKTRLLESDQQYQFEVCVASVEHNEDRTKKNQIINYLKANDIKNILDYDIIYPGLSLSQKLLKTSQKCRWLICLLTRNFMTDESLTLSCLSKLNDIICRKQVRVIIVRENDARAIPECLRWLMYVPFDERNHSHLKGLYSIISGNDIQMETQRMLSYGDVAYGLAWGYISNYLMQIIPGILNGIDPAFREKGLDRYICPRKLYIVLPKSCNVVGDLTDKERIKFFSSTSSTYLFGNKRPFYCGIYKMTSTIASVVKGCEGNFYFVGQFAPLYLFQEMKDSIMYQLNSETMEIETEVFYKILCDLMKNALPKKAMFCEFVYFDDSKSSLADIMEQKIKQIPHDTSY